MRLANYILNEENISTGEELVKVLMRDCAPFVSDLAIDNFANFLYRGSQKSFSGIISNKNKPRKDRKPRDTPMELHLRFDKLFQRKFGWKVRSSGVFATPDIYSVEEYGIFYLFFPIGKYRYVWSPEISDLYGYLSEEKYGIMHIESYFKNNIDWWYQIQHYMTMIDKIGYRYIFLKDFEYSDDIEEFIDKNDERADNMIDKALFDIVNTYKNKDIRNLLRSKNEVSILCKEYYLVDFHNYELRELFRNEAR